MTQLGRPKRSEVLKYYNSVRRVVGGDRGNLSNGEGCYNQLSFQQFNSGQWYRHYRLVTHVTCLGRRTNVDNKWRFLLGQGFPSSVSMSNYFDYLMFVEGRNVTSMKTVKERTSTERNTYVCILRNFFQFQTSDHHILIVPNSVSQFCLKNFEESDLRVGRRLGELLPEVEVEVRYRLTEKQQETNFDRR